MPTAPMRNGRVLAGRILATEAAGLISQERGREYEIILSPTLDITTNIGYNTDMKHIPKSLLIAQVDNINAVLQLKPGNQLVLQQAYGGFQLQQEVAGGGINSISSGYVSKREMNDYLNAVVVGMALRAPQVQPIY